MAKITRHGREERSPGERPVRPFTPLRYRRLSTKSSTNSLTIARHEREQSSRLRPPGAESS